MAPSVPVRIIRWLEKVASPDLNQAVYNSLAYRVAEIERHLHSHARWVGMRVPQTATLWADDSLTPFRATSGNNTYGADPGDAALVLGLGDMPRQAGMLHFDPHKVLIVSLSHDSPYKLRVIHGPGTMAAAITAGAYSETMVKIDALPQASPYLPMTVQTQYLSVGDNV